MRVCLCGFILFISICLCACSTNTNVTDNFTKPDKSSFVNRGSLTVKQQIIIKADGANHGDSSYKIIRDVLGVKSLETPDLYDGDHQEVKHIEEATDDIVGNHFIMTLHRDLDGNKGEFKGRQRNEIKVYNGSEDALKGYENIVFSYRWKMKVNAKMEVSKKFTHLFQLKPKGGKDSTPTLTLSGAERRGKDVLEIRHFTPENGKTVLKTIPWETVQGQWLYINLRTLYSDKGWLEFKIHTVADGVELVNINVPNIDMWVGTRSKHYQRPKWGIVRSLEDLHNLRAEEEEVGFADIEITRWN